MMQLQINKKIVNPAIANSANKNSQFLIKDNNNNNNNYQTKKNYL